ncbi:hypothetical protein BH09SUM1_BH09SUM1_12680 [soil metagenome]
MSSAVSAQPSLPYLPLADGLAMVPVAHGVQAYADEVRRAVHLYQPDCIAVELPRPLPPHILDLVEGLPTIRVLAYQNPAGPALMIPADPCDSLIEAVRLSSEHGIELQCIDTLAGGYGEPYETLPDDYAIAGIGLADYVKACVANLPRHPFTWREQVMAERLRELTLENERILFVGGMGHYENISALLHGPGLADPPSEESATMVVYEIIDVEERQLDRVLMEIPYTTFLYENFRSSSGPEERFPMLRALEETLFTAAGKYREEYDEEVNLTEWRALFQFGRNLSLARGRLRPHFYELLMSAKGCVDDDFGAICFEQALSYPPNAPEELTFDSTDPDGWRPENQDAEEEDAENNPENLKGGTVHLHADFGMGTERLQHAYPHPELTQIQFTFRRRPRPTKQQRDAWREQFSEEMWAGASICSWPPEDEFIEKFFRTIRKRAFQAISENHSATEEFTSSVLDGLDVRETMRRWHENKLFVRRERIPPGKIGPVVLIWRDLPLDVADIWRTCLYAENSNESDIAIYTKMLGDEMVGPGITRTEYYGILSVYPAQKIINVWMVDFLYSFKTSARLLLAAAILLSEERYVVNVSEHPPDMELRNFARLNKKAIIHLPLATFSRAILKRARQCHILAGRHVRAWAGDYIPEL